MLGQYPFYGNEVHSDLYSKYQCQERKSSASSTASTSSSESNRYVGTKSMEMSRQVLANTLQKNWTDNFPNQTSCDDSLTNLSWLHNVNPIKINEQLSFTPFIGYPKDKFNPQMLSTRNVQVYPNQSSQWLNLPNPSQPQTLQEGTKYDQPDYKNNPHLKPPFSYAILISWAMKELRKPKITLSDIYNWIVENFAFYRYADSSWQNSIRHNLSLGKCFEKVPRKKDEPGKGGFWRINPQHTKTLEVNLSKIKYNPSNNQNYNNLSEPSFAKQRLMKQICSSNNSQYQPNSTSNTVKRSRKSPLTVTQEDWDSLETFSENTSRNFHYSTPAIRVTEPPFVDDPSTFNNTCFDLSPVDNSSSDSNYYGQSSDNDISMNNFDDQSLDDILNSPMLLDKEGLSTHDDFHLLTSTNEFSDLFFPSKDDLQELDSLLGIY